MLRELTQPLKPVVTNVNSWKCSNWALKGFYRQFVVDIYFTSLENELTAKEKREYEVTITS